MDIPGTDLVYQAPGGDTFVCLMAKDADPTQALNTVAAGDCLVIGPATADENQDARKSECVSGAYPVLEVVRDVALAGAGADRIRPLREAPSAVPSTQP